MKMIGKLTLASVSSWALVLPAMAQPTAPTGTAAVEGDVIIVQARRRDESIQDVPAVVQAVTGDTLEKLNLREFQDVTAVVPGLSLTPNANGIGSVNTIRGVNFDVNLSGNAATVEFYYNGAPISSNAVLQSLFDVGQIEVLRGPQGTLQGRASPSGSINLTVRRPDLYEPGTHMNLTINDNHGWNLNGAVNVPLVEGKLGVRLAGITSEGRGDLVRPVNGSGKPKNENRGIRISAAADPLDGALKLDFTYQKQVRESLSFQQVQSVTDNRFNTDPTLTSPIFISAKDRYAVANRLAQDNHQAFDIFNWQAQVALWGQRLIYIGSDLKQSLQSLAPSDGAGIFVDQIAPLAIQAGSNAIPTGRTGRFGQATDTQSHNQSHEIRLQNDERLFGMIDYVVGYLNYDTSSDTSFDRIVGAIATPAAPARPTTLSEIRYLPLTRFSSNTEESIFGNITAHITDATEISGGLRKIWFSNNSGLLVLGQEQTNLTQDYSLDAMIYSASIKHRFNPDLMVYASTGSSWRPGAIVIGGPTQSSASPQSTLQTQFLSTPAEKSKSYEVGFKSNWLDNRLRLNVSAFYQKFKNYPFRNLAGVYSISPVSYDPNNLAALRVEAPQYASAVDVEVKGVEGELFFQPTSRLNLGMTVSYADGKIKNGLMPCTDLNGDGVDDGLSAPPDPQALFAATGTDFVSVCTVNQRANASAPWNGSFTGEYRLPVSNWSEAYLRGLFSWKGKSQGEPTNPFDQVKAYGILNLYAGFRAADGSWDVNFYGKNITNTFRVLQNLGTQTTPTLTHGTLAYTNYYGISVTEPREFGVNLRIALGSR